MSRWDRYVLRPRVWTATSRSETVPHIGPYIGPFQFEFKCYPLLHYFSRERKIVRKIMKKSLNSKILAWQSLEPTDHTHALQTHHHPPLALITIHIKIKRQVGSLHLTTMTTWKVTP